MLIHEWIKKRIKCAYCLETLPRTRRLQPHLSMKSAKSFIVSHGPIDGWTNQCEKCTYELVKIYWLVWHVNKHKLLIKTTRYLVWLEGQNAQCQPGEGKLKLIFVPPLFFVLGGEGVVFFLEGGGGAINFK